MSDDLMELNDVELNYIYFGDETDSDDILSRTLSRAVIVLETFGDINKLFFDPLIGEYFSRLL